MSKLPFISDEAILEFTRRLVEAAKGAEAAVEENPYKNVIDPFSALVDAARQGVSLEGWLEQEKSRQIQKSFQNAMGDYHQRVLGAITGWQNAGTGGSYDVINEGKKIIAEIKNKHNTMNSTSQAGTYDKLANWLDYGKNGFTAYVVEIVPKVPQPYCLPFTPSERSVQRQTRDNLLRIDGRSFYGIASGYEDALDQLYEVLPEILAEVLGLDENLLSNSEAFRELFQRAYRH